VGKRKAKTPRVLAQGPGQSGWTILEVILSLSLAATVVAAAAGLTRVVGRAFVLTESRLEVTQAARRGLERITEELRWAEAVVDDPACAPTLLCPTRVRVRIPRGNPYRHASVYEVTFQHNPRQREVERRVNSGVNNLSANIDSVTFTYLTALGAPAGSPQTTARIRVEMQVRHRAGATLAIEGEVGLRNHRAHYATPTPWSTWRPVPRGPADRIPVQPIIPPGPMGPPQPR
jgi:hypothetical protein